MRAGHSRCTAQPAPVEFRLQRLIVPALCAFLPLGRSLLVTGPSTKGKWSFPKGAKLPGERSVDGAAREVATQTGLEVRQLVNFLTQTPYPVFPSPAE
jgi:ADP-ribose pyrophosphatase YjhB (NUDIX family)